jgi:hypothetical protein
MRHQVSPVPSDDEAIAIAAAIEALWPKPQTAAAHERPNVDWRFSGRWWSESAVTRRTRPGY